MFRLSLVTPEKKIVENQELEEVTVPAFRGELNILPGHSPLTTTLTPGILKYRLSSGESSTLAIGWGYCQVTAEGVMVMTDSAVTAELVDLTAVQAQLKDLERRLETESFGDRELEVMQRQIGRLNAEKDLKQI